MHAGSMPLAPFPAYLELVEGLSFFLRLEMQHEEKSSPSTSSG